MTTQVFIKTLAARLAKLVPESSINYHEQRIINSEYVVKLSPKSCDQINGCTITSKNYNGFYYTFSVNMIDDKISYKAMLHSKHAFDPNTPQINVENYNLTKIEITNTTNRWEHEIEITKQEYPLIDPMSITKIEEHIASTITQLSQLTEADLSQANNKLIDKTHESKYDGQIEIPSGVVHWQVNTKELYRENDQ